MSPAAHRAYASPQALNRALTDKLGAHARDRPGVTLDLLRRQFAYDRLLTRIFAGPDATRWVLKGATAILARLAGDARHTRDIDLYRQDDDLPAARIRCVPQPQPMQETSSASPSTLPSASPRTGTRCGYLSSPTSDYGNSPVFTSTSLLISS